MDGVAVLIPVLDRPHLVAPLVANIAEAEGSTPTVPIFLCSPGDDAEIEEVKATGARYEIMEWVSGYGDYPKKMNYGYKLACDLGFEWVFLGADDLEFRYRWADIALAGAEGLDVCVIGTNDTVNVRVRAGHHSTHSLVHRDYGKCGIVDEPDSGKILYEGYNHWWCDDEFIGTAQWRGVFVSVLEAEVVHHHPNYGGGLDDATYEKGQATVGQDWQTHDGRKAMWGK